VVPIVFRSSGDLTLQTDELSLFLGAQWAVGPNTDLGTSYSYVHATSDYDENDRSPELDLIDSNRQVDAQIHGLSFSLRHRLRPGLRTQLGYTFQHYEDGAPVPESTGSVVTSFDRSTDRHTVTVGLTLDSEFFAKR
jgi:outer membrane receptor protein involved in Fe transport